MPTVNHNKFRKVCEDYGIDPHHAMAALQAAVNGGYCGKCHAGNLDHCEKAGIVVWRNDSGGRQITEKGHAFIQKAAPHFVAGLFQYCAEDGNDD